MGGGEKGKGAYNLVKLEAQYIQLSNCSIFLNFHFPSCGFAKKKIPLRTVRTFLVLQSYEGWCKLFLKKPTKLGSGKCQKCAEFRLFLACTPFSRSATKKVRSSSRKTWALPHQKG